MNCRSCVKEYGHKHYVENKERYAQRLEIYYQKNKSKMDVAHRAWALKHKDSIASKRKAFYKIHRTRILERQKKYRWKKYGMSEQEFNALLKKQLNRCLICKKSMRVPYVDHDHSCCKGSRSCGKCVRGLLCFNCNTFIGHAKDDVKILRAAIKYIEIAPEVRADGGTNGPTETQEGAAEPSHAASAD